MVDKRVLLSVGSIPIPSLFTMEIIVYNKEAETVVCDLQPLAKQYILQEAEKVFNGISWVNTQEELDNVYHEKVKNLYDTVDFSEFVAYL